MIDDDDFERIDDKTKTESAELRRQHAAHSRRGPLERIGSTLGSTWWLWLALAAVIGALVAVELMR